MFGLSQTTGYAILALASVEGPDGRPRLVREISDSTGISKPYLSKIMHALAGKGLVETKRGYRGGVLLARSPESVSLLEVAEAVSGTGWVERCILGYTGCSDERACPLHGFWEPIREEIRRRLRETNLAQVADFEKNHLLHCLPRHRELLADAAD